jgi:hypothetical protein
MSDINSATIQGGGGKLDRSIACILLGYTVNELLGPVADRLAMLKVSAKQADRDLHAMCLALLADNVPKVEHGPEIKFGAPIYEAANTEIAVSPIGDRAAFKKAAVTTGNQDGGNGSGGGDVSKSAHFMSMVRSESDTTFWKIDSYPIEGVDPKTTRALDSSDDSVKMMNLRTAPNLARIFRSHADAMDYRVSKKIELAALFDIILVVAVAVDSDIKVPILTPPPVGIEK